MWTILLKQLTKIVNSKIFLYLLIGGIVWFWINDRKELRTNIDRLESNQIALTEQQSRELQLTRQDFKRIFHKEDSIAKLIGIKSNQLQTVIVNNYHYKDSTTNYIPYTESTNKDTMRFIAPLGCMKVEGYTTKQGITFTKKQYNDKLHTFLYGIERKHRFLFIKWGDWVVSNAVTYSECMKDTINVEKNIKIIK